jgi:chromate transport protein ChrA
MQRDLVERRGWLDRNDFLNGVALGQTMPGPLAAQVAMWSARAGKGHSHITGCLLCSANVSANVPSLPESFLP